MDLELCRADWVGAASALAPGAHLAVLADHDGVGLEGRAAGLELRDTILILRPGPTSSFAFLFRKPVVEGTVAEQVVATGTGALNVEGCRVGTHKNVPGSLSRTPGVSLSGSKDGSLRRETGLESGHDPNVGRWPPNVVLVHSPGCVDGHCSDDCPTTLLLKRKGHPEFFPQVSSEEQLGTWLQTLTKAHKGNDDVTR